MARFDGAIALAKKLILKNGEAAILRRTTGTTPPDPAKPWKPGTPSTTDFPASAVWLSAERSLVDGALIEAGSQLVLIPASDLGTTVPDAATDRILRASGQSWKIAKVRTLSPNGQLIMHECEVKN